MRMELPITLLVLRTARGLTIAQAAQEAGVHPATWHRWEARVTVPQLDTMEALRQRWELTADQWAELTRSFATRAGT
jgi:transcriptional regulator with XRE-family HTH domain